MKFSILFRWTSGYHGQPIAFVDQSVLFYAIDDGLRFHDYTDNDNQKCLTIQVDGVGVGVIVCCFYFRNNFITKKTFVSFFRLEMLICIYLLLLIIKIHQ